ncbi:hypothetical protein [Desulforamulus hydrothermalis]|uniref:hypothetical protein n=1 Tax=Desulforamulus hydrothermalis TaxID=412895 RepID=UPI0013919E40|nr:hypothetical protein [Desulforamulus hydrothermalis]
MIPFGSGLRTDSTMIRSGGPWGGAHVLWAPPQGLLSLIKCCYRCFDKSPTGDHKSTSLCFTTFVYSLTRIKVIRVLYCVGELL